MAESGGILDKVMGTLPLVGEVFSGVSQGLQNRASRRFTERMYNRQRTDALNDWNMQNQYNSPEAQMERLKKAGLNPNLVYGHGAEGNATGMPRASSAPAWSPKAPTFNGGSVLGAYLNTQIQKAQVENLRANNELIKQNTAKAAADTTLKGMNTAKGAYDLNFRSELKDYYTDIVKWQANNLNVKNSLMTSDLAKVNNYIEMIQPRIWQKLDSEIAKNNMSIQVAAQQVLTQMAKRSTIPIEQARLQEAIKNIRSGIELRDIQKKIATKELYTGGLEGIINSVLEKYLGNKRYFRSFK